jgi:hypothetical protein
MNWWHVSELAAYWLIGVAFLTRDCMRQQDSVTLLDLAFIVAFWWIFWPITVAGNTVIWRKK